MSDNRQLADVQAHDAKTPAPRLKVMFWVSAEYVTLLEPRHVADILLAPAGQEVPSATQRRAGELAAAVARDEPVSGSREGETYDNDTALALIAAAIEDHSELFCLHGDDAVELECDAPADVRVYLAAPDAGDTARAAPAAALDVLAGEIRVLHTRILAWARILDDHPCTRRVTKATLHADAARLGGLIQAHGILAGKASDSPASASGAMDRAGAEFGINLHALAMRINASGRRQPA